MKAVLTFFVVSALVVALLFTYKTVGSRRMETACNADGPDDPSWRSIEYGWSWIPPGFQCTYDDGRQRTSLWF